MCCARCVLLYVLPKSGNGFLTFNTLCNVEQTCMNVDLVRNWFCGSLKLELYCWWRHSCVMFDVKRSETTAAGVAESEGQQT